MSKIQCVGMLLVNSSRSRAYLQMLIKHHLFPAHVILVENNIKKKENIKKFDKDLVEKYFDISEDILDTLMSHRLSYEIVVSQNMNSNEVLRALKKRDEKYFIYSGWSGEILKGDILNTGQNFIHMHAGRLPDFRGSTTIYYSILKENTCTVTALFLNENIDEGRVIKTKDFPKPDDVEIIDYVYDSFIRASVLVEVMRDYVHTGFFETKAQCIDNGETYFIIHPVLKHIAILCC
ncbi:MAG: hypothetical protein HYS98_00320 [Deltaproteobacteria bacterium]|nr:hypothetical protein [Deltaproteobacteria bacterium]